MKTVLRYIKKTNNISLSPPTFLGQPNWSWLGITIVDIPLSHIILVGIDSALHQLVWHLPWLSCFLHNLKSEFDRSNMWVISESGFVIALSFDSLVLLLLFMCLKIFYWMLVIVNKTMVLLLVQQCEHWVDPHRSWAGIGFCYCCGYCPCIICFKLF